MNLYDISSNNCQKLKNTLDCSKSSIKSFWTRKCVTFEPQLFIFFCCGKNPQNLKIVIGPLLTLAGQWGEPFIFTKTLSPFL
jgi:hypothetical protein